MTELMKAIEARRKADMNKRAAEQCHLMWQKTKQSNDRYTQSIAPPKATSH